MTVPKDPKRPDENAGGSTSDINSNTNDSINDDNINNDNINHSNYDEIRGEHNPTSNDSFKSKMLDSIRIPSLLKTPFTVSTPYKSSSSKKPKPLNMVLPSYESELLPTNEINRESQPKEFIQRLLYSAKKYIFPSKSYPEKRGRLQNAVNSLLHTPFDYENIVVIGVHGMHYTRNGKLINVNRYIRMVPQQVAHEGRWRAKWDLPSFCR